VSADGSSASFRRSFGGSFRIKANVNGSDVPMVFDTGATAVVLTAEDAETAGIDISRLRYSVRVQTANGVGQAASITLDSIVIGDIERQGIRAFVAERGALETSLLGMTFLETLSGYAVRNDSLEFHD
jgi:aspartyl protease family protein